MKQDSHQVQKWEGRQPVWEAPSMENLDLATTEAPSGSTPFSSSTVGPRALGYCSVAKTGMFSAAAPRT